MINADQVGHELLLRPSPAYDEIIENFGREVLDSAGEIDRKRLGAVVFKDPERLRKLNSILHPKIIARQEELAAQFHRESPGSVIIVEAALIYEAGVEEKFSKILVAWCKPRQQIERLLAKTGMSREEAKARIAAQMPLEEKRRRADFVIDCSGSLEETQAQVEMIYPQLQRLAAL